MSSSNNRPIPPPIFILRGHHQTGVTAVNFIEDFTHPYLISGDQDGVLIWWNLTTFRVATKAHELTKGKILSIRRIFPNTKFTNDDTNTAILVVQSREGLVKLVRFQEKKGSPMEDNILVIGELKSYPSSSIWFSRGDAITIKDKSYLAHSSFMEELQVTLRVLNESFETVSSATIKRPSQGNSTPSCFDIRLIESSQDGELYAIVGYEDGVMCIYSCKSEIPIDKATTGHLDRKGQSLKVTLLKCVGASSEEFVTSFDYSPQLSLLVSGSPSNQIRISDLKLEHSEESIVGQDLIVGSRYSDLKNNGVSRISFRPDSRLIAVALWNSQVRIYTSKKLKLLALLNNHQKQVEDIIFIEDKWMSSSGHGPKPFGGNTSFIMVCASSDKTISLWSLFNETTN